jgi:NitT/TauT family transport system ATP-binding protein
MTQLTSRSVDRTAPILSARHITKTFQTPEGGHLKVLDDITLEVHDREIVALLGRSGSGKSTLLRSMLGLLTPSAGEVRYREQTVRGPMPGMAMVFQSFALFPWLTVQQNVELGLEAQGVRAKERQTRALAAIDLIGLDGFESAYPKELSGGMRQRVGFARALVTNPDMLFLDEPFSALDVLTSETLRSELLDLFLEERIPTRSLLIVTHNIEEAVLMANRIVVLAPNPGRVRAEIRVDLSYPRDRDSHEFKDLVERVYAIMTTRPEHDVRAGSIDPGGDRASIMYRLPPAALNALMGLLERVGTGPDYGREDLPKLADDMSLEIDDLFPLVDAADMLGFATVREGDITLTREGERFAGAPDVQEQKQLFAGALLERVPLVAHIRQVLLNRPQGRAPEERFLRELEDFMSEGDAEKVLATAIDWGRFAELYEYDYNSGVLMLEGVLARD